MTQRTSTRPGRLKNGARRKSEQGDAGAGRIRVRRFDADQKDQILSLDEAMAAPPSERQVLWIDVVGDLTTGEAESLSKGLSLDARTRRSLEAPGKGPYIAIHGQYFHVRLAVEPDDKQLERTPWLDIVAGRNVVISRHAVPLRSLHEFDQRIEADATLGQLGSATFVAALLDAAITSYHGAVDSIEDDVDALDAKSLKDDRRDLLPELVALRRRISRLRRLLSDHRSLFASLAAPDIEAFSGDPDGAAALQAVTARFEGAIGAVEDSREILLGSFDVYMTRTAQRTNDVMKVLALATVLLLPGSLVAGLLGMNVVIPLSKDDPMSFWFVVAGVAAFAAAIVIVARARRWL